MTKTLLDVVHADHRNMAVLLELLRSDVDALRGGDDQALDIERLTDVVDYFGHYPDRVHHPREETMFAVFREHHEASPELGNALRRVHEQHETLPKLTVAVSEMLDAAAHGSLVLRDELVTQLDHFIESQLEHLDLEEGLIFPELREKMNAQDWLKVEALGPQGRDPIFGAEVEAEYRNLYRRLEAFLS
ncbi:hemerythrin domain-containing protein [Acidihalobacter ferrooxydans]|uniref:Hemerythrin-like domain-containing protein n=1 Tax=Acidihalobacter ferrooxydans TaxID=1765967 RepID=A0A1P8UK04_9GAMM|nr:hemerythrin domain-containing protein [Acidihalobacter ferrooxydans]APZ44173.1 hypothetical protein BW247_14660 [Acidihalobacter ferrooxydans]